MAANTSLVDAAKLPGAADEGAALQILLVARLLADEEDARIQRPLAEHRLRRVLVEVAARAAARLLPQCLPGRDRVVADLRRARRLDHPVLPRLRARQQRNFLATLLGNMSDAYLRATVFTRESVRVSQQVNYERALRDFETQMASAAATKRAGTPEEVAAVAASSAANARLLEQLRGLRPTGRVVLQLNQESDALPELVLEDGDTLVLTGGTEALARAFEALGPVLLVDDLQWCDPATVEWLLMLAQSDRLRWRAAARPPHSRN